jgi:hypothetical protein
MLELAVSFAAGLVVGWNLLPQPTWVKEIYERVASWVNGK